MRDLITIMRRELAEYCNSPIGAIFLVVFALIASGLFVTEFFLFPVAELRGLFQVLPFMLCVFVPAVAMRLWAEERSSNTMEMLLTFPMHPMSLVLGKYLAGFCFLLLALASTLLLPLMVTALGRPDFGQIASSYLGAILLGGFFLALGQLVSGFARDQIVAFVLSLLACFGIFLLGTNFAATALDSWIGGLGTLLRELLGVTGRYGVFARGIVEVADLAFFLVWVALFLFLNGLHIEGRGRRGFAAFFTLCAGLCLGIGLFCNALLSDVSLARFDWTEGRIHSVSPASQRILAGLSVPVQISYYVTPEEDMPTEIKTLERDVLDRLEELRLVSGGKLTYKRVHMRAANVVGGDPLAAQGPNTDPLEKRMLEKGVEPFSVSAMRQTGSVSDLIYSSLGVAYKDDPIATRAFLDELGDPYALVLVDTVNIVINGIQNLFFRHLTRFKRRNRRFNWAGRNNKRLVAITSSMQNLHENFCAMFMYGMCYQTMWSNIPQRIHRSTRRKEPTLTVWRNPACNDQANTAFSTLTEVCCQFWIIIKTIFQARMHGAHHHTVFNGGKTQM